MRSTEEGVGRIQTETEGLALRSDRRSSEMDLISIQDAVLNHEIAALVTKWVYVIP